MSDSIKVRKARAVFEHASRSYDRLVSAGLASNRQDVDDAWLVKELAALDLEEAQQTTEESHAEAPR